MSQAKRDEGIWLGGLLDGESASAPVVYVPRAPQRIRRPMVRAGWLAMLGAAGMVFALVGSPVS